MATYIYIYRVNFFWWGLDFPHGFITPKTPGPFFPIRNWGGLRFGRLGRFRGTRNLKRTFIAPEDGIPSAPNTRLGSVFFGTQFPTPKPRLQKGAVSIREWLECWFSSGMAYFQGKLLVSGSVIYHRIPTLDWSVTSNQNISFSPKLNSSPLFEVSRFGKVWKTPSIISILWFVELLRCIVYKL